MSSHEFAFVDWRDAIVRAYADQSLRMVRFRPSAVEQRSVFVFTMYLPLAVRASFTVCFIYAYCVCACVCVRVCVCLGAPQYLGA